MMEKKRSIRLLIFAICFITLATNLFAQQKDTKIENAAAYYSKAFDLMKYPESEELKNKIQGTIESGWKEEDKELERILSENEPCFNEFKKGLPLGKCDFNFGKEYKYLIQKKLPPLLKVRNLSNLLLIKGRYYEKQEEFGKAVNVYLSSLTFAQHISQDDTIVSKMIALAVEKGTFPLIKQYLDSEKVERGTCLRIQNYLIKYEKDHFPAKELVEVEREFFISAVKMLRDETKQKAQEDQEFNEEKKKAMEALGEELVIQAQELADRYYGNFAKAAETNEEADWEFATSESEFLIEISTSTITHIKDVGSIFYDAFTKDVEGSRKTIARKIVTLTLAIAIPNFKRAAENYYSTLKELKELKSNASIKCKEMD